MTKNIAAAVLSCVQGAVTRRKHGSLREERDEDYDRYQEVDWDLTGPITRDVYHILERDPIKGTRETIINIHTHKIIREIFGE